MEYTEHQKAYIESVDGLAHNSAVELIGLLDARISKLEAELAQRTADTNAMVGNCEAKIAELEAQLAAAQERERWIPVTERLPEKDGNYLVVKVNSITGKRIVTRDEYFSGFGQFLSSSVILWRELPAPPEADHA